MTTTVPGLFFIARHEIRLAWRDFVAMMTAGRAGRSRAAIIGLVVFVAAMHLLAFAVIGKFAKIPTAPDRTTLIVIAATLVLSWALMLSQAMESVTRVFYSRADLDLIMSSPISLTRIFAVRMAAIALAVTMMTLLFSMPFINVLAIGCGLRWLSAYGAIIAIGLSASAMAMLLTTMLFRVIGPARTRSFAQILAAVIGAGFVITLQVVAIISYGTLSRFAVLTSDAVASFAPNAESMVWWPAKAVLGDGAALSLMLAMSCILLGATIAILAPRMDDKVIVASGVVATAARHADSTGSFRRMSRRQALRRKEFVLLKRDPWLLSQTLMQLLYLLPPALMLWRNLGDASTAAVVVAPVLVMAAGQLAGGLAWLTISGEDAPDLVATSPLPASRVTLAKIEAVLIAVGIVFTPLLVLFVFLAPGSAAVSLVGIAVAAVSSTAIQLWFAVRARRSQFRRRQTTSRFAAIAEALSSIGWAATTVLALLAPVVAAVTGFMTMGVIAVTWKLSPRAALSRA
jgi:ABC-2 type transport system permease protein